MRAAENTLEQLYRGGIIILRPECSQLTLDLTQPMPENEQFNRRRYDSADPKEAGAGPDRIWPRDLRHDSGYSTKARKRSRKRKYPTRESRYQNDKTDAAGGDMTWYYIYGIVHSRQTLRYVGKSSDPHSRFQAHFSNPTSEEMKHWTGEVDRSDVSLVLIDRRLIESSRMHPLSSEERFWITTAWSMGFPLLNHDYKRRENVKNAYRIYLWNLIYRHGI